MADRLSQLQDAIDQLTTLAAKIELARDLIFKSKQIEFLITSLPGIGVSEDEQQERLRNLENEYKEAEAQRLEAVRAREEAAEKLDMVIRSLRRS
ncbi:hypothetical protein P167DRAFT_553795 [Morchella conica CCBAS932]|uniref:Mediator of RNA polymerase II transcription subunit 21 n=1 Tax=Morchella conica CCBAS932 TaxID=1392247 RepID=A0A3N4KMC2_9PEZI|nr:hypothetical protein P167DRAFT_553795 [Morchella conica CCBAS932]